MERRSSGSGAAERALNNMGLTWKHEIILIYRARNHISLNNSAARQGGCLEKAFCAYRTILEGSRAGCGWRSRCEYRIDSKQRARKGKAMMGPQNSRDGWYGKLIKYRMIPYSTRRGMLTTAVLRAAGHFSVGTHKHSPVPVVAKTKRPYIKDTHHVAHTAATYIHTTTNYQNLKTTCSACLAPQIKIYTPTDATQLTDAAPCFASCADKMTKKKLQ